MGLRFLTMPPLAAQEAVEPVEPGEPPVEPPGEPTIGPFEPVAPGAAYAAEVPRMPTVTAADPPTWLLRLALGLALLGLTGLAATAYLRVWAGQLAPAGLMTLLWLGVAWTGAAKLRAGWPWWLVALGAALVLLVVPVALLVVPVLLRG